MNLKLIDKVHAGYVHGRRVRVLAETLAPLLPEGASLLDVGCGDGLLDSELKRRRSDLTVRGVDVAVREGAHIPVDRFDGMTIPFEEDAFDVVQFVDVLHHTTEPKVLLREAGRVASRCVLIKDHLADGFLAKPTLRFMDCTGNERHSVSLPFNYWKQLQWTQAFQELGLRIAHWSTELALYPWPASWIFGRSLHFVARLEPVGGN